LQQAAGQFALTTAIFSRVFGAEFARRRAKLVETAEATNLSLLVLGVVIALTQIGVIALLAFYLWRREETIRQDRMDVSHREQDVVRQLLAFHSKHFARLENLVELHINRAVVLDQNVASEGDTQGSAVPGPAESNVTRIEPDVFGGGQI
jgi:hypothetical protein